MSGNKKIWITYFLWLFFGWFGLHHVYLGRDRQAFVWWSTLGGIYYIGWIRDFWRIPEYVDAANEEPYYMERLYQQIKLRTEPRFNISRFVGEIAVGYFYGVLVRMAIPEEVPLFFLGFFVSIGVTAGVYLVGNIGHEKGPFARTYFATLAAYYLFNVICGPDVSYMYCAIVSTGQFNYLREYDDTNREKKFGARMCDLIKGAAIIWLLWTSFFYFNASITLQNNEKIKVRDSINNFFKSPAWLDFKNTMWLLYTGWSAHGWNDSYEDIIDAFDPTGESNAYKVLEIEKNASKEVIRKAYKKLIIKWHPDRNKGPDKESAEKKFIEIQKAYELLSTRRKTSYTDREGRSEF